VAQAGLQSSPFETRAQSPLAQANYQLWIEHARAENRRELERLVATLHEDCEYEVVPLGLRWRGKDAVREFGRMDGPLFGAEPSGKELGYRVVIFFPVRDGRFTGERVYFDLADFARQVPAARGFLDRRPN
jgi:hypothetical protein